MILRVGPEDSIGGLSRCRFPGLGLYRRGSLGGADESVTDSTGSKAD